MVDFNKMGVTELKVYAKEKEICLDGAKTKMEIIAAIAEADSAKAEKVAFEVMGVNGTIDISLFDDADVFEWLGEIQDGNAFVYTKLCKRLFGEDWKRVRSELEDGRDRLTATRLVAFFSELMEVVGAKN